MKRLATFTLIILLSAAMQSYADEQEGRKKIRSTASQLFSEGNFAELEVMANKFRDFKERTPSGVWKLTYFYLGIYDALDFRRADNQFWKDQEKKSSAWISEFPQSVTPYVVRGMVFINHGRMFARKAQSQEMPELNWREYSAKIKYAEANLLAAKYGFGATRDPRWYELMFMLARILNKYISEYNKLLEEAVSEHPYYYQIYFSALDYLNRRYPDDDEALNQLVAIAVENTQEHEKNGLYARMYWYAAQSRYKNRLFLEANVNWEKMKRSIDDVLALYPDQWNINNFAYFSCMAQDKENTYRLFSQIKTPSGRAWKNQSIYSLCGGWASNQDGFPNPFDVNNKQGINKTKNKQH